MSIYVQHDGKQLGPLTEAEIKAQLASGAISLQDHVWWDGQADWAPLSQTPYGGSVAPGAPVVSGMPPSAAYPAGTIAPTSKLAIWALVFGCLGFVFSLFASIPAIVLGHLGLNQIKKNPSLRGHGMALAGLILGYVFTVLLPVISIIAIAVLIALGNQVKSVFSTINSQLATEQATNSPDQTTNAPDQSTPAPATTNSPDQSTNSAPASTNSPSTNASDSSTNAAPVNQ
jgi:hypothetical protein